MNPSVFGIIELLETTILSEAHAMNKSITQATQNDKLIGYGRLFFYERIRVSKDFLRDFMFLQL